MHDNDAAKRVIRTTSEDCKILNVRLREMFQNCSEVENKKLQMELEQLKPRSKENPREYYDRTLYANKCCLEKRTECETVV